MVRRALRLAGSVTAAAVLSVLLVSPASADQPLPIPPLPTGVPGCC